VETFVDNFYLMADKSSSALLNFVSAQRWLGVRIEVLGSFIVLAACILVISLNDILGLTPGVVALLIIWCTNFTITLGFFVDFFAEGEAAITSIERVDAMATIPQEKTMTTDPSHQLPSSWPERGRLEFNDVCLRYREGLPLALNKLSFVIPPGARCGVVGRTGAGKSSLTVALFRISEIESGSIMLDGVDLSLLGLSDVRGRANGMAIIPQGNFFWLCLIVSCGLDDLAF
jgi:ABC-type multidrug transport system fused ATPase/permease subunit